MKLIKKIFLLFALCLINSFLFAQNATTAQPVTTDFMESNGKIYVVIAVIIVIIIGLFLYLFSLDRKISKLEKEAKK